MAPWAVHAPFLEAGAIDRAYFAPWELDPFYDDQQCYREKHLSAEDRARQAGIPLFGSMSWSSTSAGSELTERALSTLQSNNKEGGKLKSRSVTVSLL